MKRAALAFFKNFATLVKKSRKGGEKEEKVKTNLFCQPFSKYRKCDHSGRSAVTFVQKSPIMKQFCLHLLLCCCAWSLQAQTAPERYSRVEISLIGKNIENLAALGIETDHGKFLPGRSLTTEVSETELQWIQNAGFQTNVLIPDVQQWYRERAKNPPVAPRSGGCSDFAPDYPTPVNYTYGTMAGYLTYQQMLDVLDDMAAKFPNLITTKAVVSDTNLTWEGRPLLYVKISDNPNADEPEKEVLYTALHHAREPNSLSQMIFYMWYLLENYDTNPEIQYLVNNLEMYFIPCVNPDGYIYNETTNPDGYGFWRKNRRDNGDGTFGVDLNRNYGYFWGNDDSGSSPITAGQTYRGPAPFSEPETRAVRDFCRDHNFVFTFNYHTSGNLLIYPWAYSDTPADSAFVKYAQLFTRYNNYTYGTSGQTVGYAVNGSSDDWMLGETGILSYTPEVGTTGFWPAFDEIDGLNRDNVWQNLSMALCALRFAEVTDQNGQFLSAGTSSLSFSLRRYGLEDGPFTVTLAPLSPEVTSASASQTFDLQTFESVDFNFPVTFAPNIPTGKEVMFLLQADNGTYVQTDTLRKTYLGNGGLSLLYENACDDFSGWQGNFELTDETYVSAPSCFTDSPNAYYFPNSVVASYFEDPVEIPSDALFAQLRFFARWDIEEDKDYAQVFAMDETFTPTALCGSYSEPGAGYPQPDVEPVYDGLQSQWVEETIDLSAYIGKSIYIGFLFQSDDFLERDGFFFDDVRIEYADAVSSTPAVLAPGAFRLMQNQPNPATDATVLQWEHDKNIAGDASLLVFNALGEKVLERNVNLNAENQARLDTRAWPAGIYTCLLRTAGGQTKPVKMNVLHR